MDRRRFVAGAAATLLGASRAPAQEKPRRRLAILEPGPLEFMMENPASYVPFFAELERRGYVEGETLSVQRYTSYRRTVAELDTLARGVLSTLPEVVFANGAGPALALQRQGAALPVVYGGPDPVRLGLVANPRRPGGNVTGAALDAGPEEFALRLGLLREAVPRARRVAYLGLVGTAEFDLAPLRAAAAAAGLTVLPVLLEETSDEAELRGAFQRMAGAEAVLVAFAAATGIGHGGLGGPIADLAVAHRLPALVHFGADATGAYAPTAALLNYRRSEGANIETYGQLAGYVVRILGGEKAGDLPILATGGFELVVNRKTARALGLALPQSLLARAQQVIE